MVDSSHVAHKVKPSWREEVDVDEVALEGEWSEDGVDSEWTSSK